MWAGTIARWTFVGTRARAGTVEFTVECGGAERRWTAAVGIVADEAECWQVINAMRKAARVSVRVGGCSVPELVFYDSDIRVSAFARLSTHMQIQM